MELTATQLIWLWELYPRMSHQRNLPRWFTHTRRWFAHPSSCCVLYIGNQQREIYCDVCSTDSYFGARWKCVECDDYDLCDECYHGDMHDVTHQFKRLDLRTSEGSVKLLRCFMAQKINYTYKTSMNLLLIRNWCRWQTLSLHSPGGSTLLREMTSRPPSWNCGVIHQKSVSVNQCVFTRRTILPNFTTILFETTQP